MSRTPPRSHFVPRTRSGRVAVVAFLLLFVLAMPPVTHRVLDRPDVFVGGLPLFFVALFAVYCALVGVLLWTLKRGL